MNLGIFIPIANNGWMMSVNSPQYMPSFQLNRTIAAKAEAYGFNFLLSMVKLRGFGGRTEFWDHNLESFTLMAGLACGEPSLLAWQDLERSAYAFLAVPDESAVACMKALAARTPPVAAGGFCRRSESLTVRGGSVGAPSSPEEETAVRRKR